MEEKKEPVRFRTCIHRGRTETEPKVVFYDKVFQLIISERYKESTEKHRYYLSIGDFSRAKYYKDNSEFITPSVICEGGRTTKHVVGYTSVLMGDIDDCAPGVAEQLVVKLGSNPHVHLAHVTHSGHGVHFFYPVDTVDKKYHSQAYEQGKVYFEQFLGAKLDGACKNLTRTAYLCYDPHAQYNPAPVPLHVETVEEPKKQTGRPPKVCHASIGQAAPAVLSVLAEQGKIYESGRRNEFISCALYLMNDFGVPQQDAWGWACGEFPDFDATELDGILRSVYQHTESHGTKSLPKQKDGQFKYATLAETEAFILTQAEIRHNVITDRREIRMSDESTFRNLTDRDENTLWRHANRSGVYIGPGFIPPILNSDFVPEFNPFVEYFEHLPKWDGVTDYIGELAETVQTTTPDMFRFCFRKWFVAIVASILVKKIVNHEILVFIGEQGSYKTTWFNRLLPPELETYFYTKINCARATKDDQFTLAEFGLICFEEIEGMRLAELNQLKAMITMPTVNERAAYARNKSQRPHIASFCGTGNNISFLSDPTGNRRWLPFEIKSIVDPFTYRVKYDGVYSQALYLFRHKFCYWFTQEEIKLLNTHNEQFEVPNLEEELIRTYYRKPKPGERCSFVTVSAMLQRINALIKIPLSAIKIGIIMRKMEFNCHKSNGNRGYRVVEMTPEELSDNKSFKENTTDQKLPF